MNTLRSSLRLAALSASFAATALHAAPQTFDFTDPKGVNNVQFKLDAPLESISGSGNGVSGNVTFDLAAPAATTGRIVLDAKSLTVGNPVMQQHLHGADWLDVARHPTITFEAVKLDNVRTEGAVTRADVAGKLTVKGVTKDITVPVSFTHLADKLGARAGDPMVKGDLLVLRASFEINRSDFNIMPGQATDKVAENIVLSLALAGASPKN